MTKPPRKWRPYMPQQYPESAQADAREEPDKSVYRVVVTLPVLLDLRERARKLKNMCDAYLDHERINRDLAGVAKLLDRMILVCRTRQDESLSVEEVQTYGAVDESDRSL